MNVAADLHVHTTASDGLHSPAEVTRLAAARGLDAIAVTDHDTVDGIAPALAASRQVQLEVIPGIELSTDYRNFEVHILGYYIDTGYPRLLALLRQLRESRISRAEKMMAKLAALGYKLEPERVRQISGPAAPGRPHIARALLEKGMVSSLGQAFDTLIAPGGPAYVDRFKLTPAEAIALIREAGGVAVLAHPGLSGGEDMVYELCGFGLQGLEACHPDHNASQSGRFRCLAGELGLFVTGGSDFHGPGGETGGQLASCGVSREELLKFRTEAGVL
jgi:predicted metal-dependent phosphoesterase TrpH